MSIAPITPSFGFGVTPGFGINPAYGVSATPPRTEVGLESHTQGATTFGQVLSERVAASGPAAATPGVASVQSSMGAFGVPSAVPSTPAMGQVDAAAASAQGRTSYGSDMSGFVSNKLGELSGMHARSDKLAVAAATGELKDVHEYTIAANEAGIATQLAVSVRDKALQAFNDIIRMQL